MAYPQINHDKILDCIYVVIIISFTYNYALLQCETYLLFMLYFLSAYQLSENSGSVLNIRI